MVIITNIYAPNAATARMIDSFEKHGHEVAVLNTPTGNGGIMRSLWECYKRAATGHDLFCYSDAGDTVCQRPVKVPTNYLLWSTEKACYPDTSLSSQYTYPQRYKGEWRYLNNGVYGGPLALVIEFFERYGLCNLPQNANGQNETMVAYLQAVKDGFPIKLDLNCTEFQSIAFDHDPIRNDYPIHAKGYEGIDFEIVGGMVRNKATKTTPAILHGNGQTPMAWIP
jgi:hypothetical protein